MTSFSKDEMVRIVLFYGKFENYQNVRNEYVKFYGISKHPRDLPDVRMFKSVIDRFLGTGSVHKKGAGDLCSLPPDEVRRAAENLLVRCRACRDMGGGHFEHVLKKYKSMAPEE